MPALMWRLEGINYANYNQSAVHLQFAIKWDSSFSTPSFNPFPESTTGTQQYPLSFSIIVCNLLIVTVNRTRESGKMAHTAPDLPAGMVC
ncbi:hypothetical protein GJAV_G00115680 [Gymnothorax javanicus]|nr:hypothetical protein GJAV_G00115680 [Gymnothorax javanicus]